MKHRRLCVFGLVSTCLFAFFVPMNPARACAAPIEFERVLASVDTVLLATALDDIVYASHQGASARVDKVILGKYNGKTFPVLSSVWWSSCRRGDDMPRGAKLVLYGRSYKPERGQDQVELLYWLTLDEARSRDPRFTEKP
jgi:hypothetical protein